MGQKLFANTYQPSGQTYNYICNLQDTEVGWTPEESTTLESHGYDTTYPGSYCNTVVFGGTEIEVTSVLGLNPRNQSVMSQIGYAVKGFDDYKVDLARPLQTQYNLADKFYTGMEFGQSVGETVPAKIRVVQTDSGTSVLWYDNDVLVNTDTMSNSFDWFALAVVVSGNTIKKYAYIFMVNGSLYTSGAKTNASVLSILNDGGYAGGGDTGRNGWTDEDLGDFIISKIYNRDGNPAYSGWVAGGRTTETIATANEDLEQRCHNYGGYLGTDVVEYITGMDNGDAWTYLTTNPASDGLSMTIPSATPETAYYIKWNYTSQQFDIYLNETLQGSTTIYTGYHTEGSHLYITWYNQNDDVSLASRFPLVWMIRTSGDYRVPQYQMYTPGLGSDLDLEEFDYSTGFWNDIDGYDPELGQEDESQEDPDDIEDPSNDPLSSGFLYAFMVSKTDMIHLMEALTPETLAQKIRVDFGNNLFDFIVSYHMMPCLTNADSENKVTISYRGNAFTYGDDDTQLMLAPISKSWYRVDCGTVICQPKTTTEHPLRWDGFENWSSAQVQLYLPFIGYVHLNTADVWGQAIHIVYIFDILQGTCTANIGVGNKGTLYTFYFFLLWVSVVVYRLSLVVVSRAYSLWECGLIVVASLLAEHDL